MTKPALISPCKPKYSLQPQGIPTEKPPKPLQPTMWLNKINPLKTSSAAC
jgi:hypothetical protein